MRFQKYQEKCGSVEDPRRIRGGSAADPRRIRGRSAADPRWIRGGSAADPRQIRGRSAADPRRDKNPRLSDNEEEAENIKKQGGIREITADFFKFEGVDAALNEELFADMDLDDLADELAGMEELEL